MYENFKSAVEGVVSASVGLVLTTVIVKNTPADLTFLPKLGMRVGTLVIGSLLSNMAAKKITDGMDNMATGIQTSIDEAEAEIKNQNQLLENIKAVNEEAMKPKRKPAAKKPVVKDI
jgi:hypothetical protein